MNEKEAIEIINNVNWEEYDRCYCLMKPARDMAIKALEAQTKLKEYIERINQPEYKNITWKKDEVVLLLKELVAK